MLDDVGVDRPGWCPASRADEPDHHRKAAAVDLLGMDLDGAGADDRDGPDGSRRARTPLLDPRPCLRVVAGHGLLPSRTDACGRPVETMMHPARAGSTTSLDGRPDSSSLAGALRLVEPIGILQRGVGRSDGRTTTRSPITPVAAPGCDGGHVAPGWRGAPSSSSKRRPAAATGRSDALRRRPALASRRACDVHTSCRRRGNSPCPFTCFAPLAYRIHTSQIDGPVDA